MRKWMSERLKRRKKEPEKVGTDPAQAPLQPESAQEVPSVEPQPAQPQQGGNGDVAKRRRRRGRGGRGRGRNGAPSAEFAETGGEPQPLQTALKESPAPTAAASHGRATAKAPLTPPQAEVPRASKGVVVLAIGLPGSGKSSWFKRHNITPLSSDLLRALLFDDPTEQRFQDLI